MTGAGQALAGLFMAGRDPALPTNSLDKAVLISLQTEAARVERLHKGTALRPYPPPSLLLPL